MINTLVNRAKSQGISNWVEPFLNDSRTIKHVPHSFVRVGITKNPTPLSYLRKRDITLLVGDYRDFTDFENCFIFCRPPIDELTEDLFDWTMSQGKNNIVVVDFRLL